jgi:hypothetical protein
MLVPFPFLLKLVLLLHLLLLQFLLPKQLLCKLLHLHHLYLCPVPLILRVEFNMDWQTLLCTCLTFSTPHSTIPKASNTCSSFSDMWLRPFPPHLMMANNTRPFQLSRRRVLQRGTCFKTGLASLFCGKIWTFMPFLPGEISTSPRCLMLNVLLEEHC